MIEQIFFSVNTYDNEGDEVDNGVFLHFGDTMLKVADDPDDYDRFVEKLGGMSKEIHDYGR